MNWILNNTNDNEAVDTLSKELKISPILSSMLVKRQIRTYDQAKDFFRPNYESLHDPFLMKDMDRATKRLNKAIQDKESIMVFGDYDVDGTSSVALITLYLESQGLKILKYIPDRTKEGYGVSMKAIDLAISKKLKLIIALDCGIKAHNQVDYAKKNKIDFIICDHHNPDEKLPNALAILNPKRKDCEYPFKELCGCGVGFKLIQALDRDLTYNSDLVNYLDLVALAIAADVVPVIGENRIMAFLGLQIINSNPRIGIHSILKSNQKKEYIISDLMFFVAPRINAAGRIKHAELALQLLISSNEEHANLLAKEIESLNSERRLIEKQMTSEAVLQVEEDKECNSIVVYSSSWNKGVVGIVASRLVDKFYKPSVVFCESSNGTLTASARSIKGVDLYKIIKSCDDLVVQYGGHKYAAGLTIKKENINLFKKRFDDAVSEMQSNQPVKKEILIESKINFDEITPKFFRILKQFEPFGPGNKAPLFLTENLKLKGKPYELGKEKEHIKMNLKQDISDQFSSIGFWLANKFQSIENKSNFSAVYSIEENNWKDRTTIQLNLKDFK
jgi:single-stranded-DNA-specific exonuclease